MRHHDGRVEVVVEVIDTRDQSRVWGERYERPVTEVQGLQRELARRIANGLRVRFTPNGRTRFEQLHTASSDAYEMYLKGRHFWNKRTASALRTSVSYFNRAIEADPSFALAYSGLADSYGLLTEYHTLPATETYDHVRRAVTRALELDPDLPEAHTSRGYLREFYEWDWRGAEEEFRSRGC